MFMFTPEKVATVELSSTHGPSLDCLEALSTDFVRAFNQSGVRDMAGDLGWLHVPRLIKFISLAHDYHYGKLRNNGGEMRTIHEIRMVHRAWNDKGLIKWQIENKLPRDFAAAVAATHDYRENSQDSMDVIESKCAQIWQDDSTLDQLFRKQIFLTDSGKLHGWERILGQIKKAYDERGNFKADFCEQRIRAIDKSDHGEGDARFCVNEAHRIYKKYVAAQGNPSLFEEARREHVRLMEIAADAYHQAIIKRFPMGYPATPRDEKFAYFRNERILLKIMQGDLQPKARAEPLRCMWHDLANLILVTKGHEIERTQMHLTAARSFPKIALSPVVVG